MSKSLLMRLSNQIRIVVDSVDRQVIETKKTIWNCIGSKSQVLGNRGSNQRRLIFRLKRFLDVKYQGYTKINATDRMFGKYRKGYQY